MATQKRVDEPTAVAGLIDQARAALSTAIKEGDAAAIVAAHDVLNELEAVAARVRHEHATVTSSRTS